MVIEKKEKDKDQELRRAAYLFACDKSKRAGFGQKAQVFHDIFEKALSKELQIPAKYFLNSR